MKINIGSNTQKIDDFLNIDYRGIERVDDTFLPEKIDWEYSNSRIFGNSKIAKEMYGAEQKISDFSGSYLYESGYHKAVLNSNMLVECMQKVGLNNIKIISQIPNKKKHPHEICVIGYKK